MLLPRADIAPLLHLVVEITQVLLDPEEKC